MPLPPTFDIRLVSRRAISPAVRELTFERVDGSPIAFEAGQWVNLVLPIASGEIRRAYSVASPPDGTNQFQLAITHVEGGPGSTYLHEAPLGSLLKAVGPQGFFTRTKFADAPSLFVATGTGITPFRSMILEGKLTAPTWLLFGARTEADLIYRDELEKTARNQPNLHVEYTLSRPHEAWPGKSGYVQTHVREIWNSLSAIAPPHAYICGLERMVSAVRALLREDLQVPRQQVHSERYD
jgi:CDP-4-dehydro-6-deoxyglucose reductase, E3